MINGLTAQSCTVTQLTGKLARVKTTLDLPDELVREMKLRALMQGRTPASDPTLARFTDSNQ